MLHCHQGQSSTLLKKKSFEGYKIAQRRVKEKTCCAQLIGYRGTWRTSERRSASVLSDSTALKS